ncbi:hypothetical protein Avbf_14668 [Armadillidium vulgare]|nr:hypothetical protein Avbf_14668 [Armadillidium vulgare]
MTTGETVGEMLCSAIKEKGIKEFKGKERLHLFTRLCQEVGSFAEKITDRLCCKNGHVQKCS